SPARCRPPLAALRRWRGLRLRECIAFAALGVQRCGAGFRAIPDRRLDLDLHPGVRLFGALVQPLPPGGIASPADVGVAPSRRRIGSRWRQPATAPAAPIHPERIRFMNFGLLIVGDEILSGKRADKHMPKVIELLGARGLSLAWARYVGDDPARITDELRFAFASGDAVFSCGGIGATPDDHTRQCAATALGVSLALHPVAKEFVIERMRDVAREQGQPF